jgi:quercetin dioxygenase-like cupin family protein
MAASRSGWRHHIGRLERGAMSTPAAYHGRSGGYRRQVLVDGQTGSVHMGLGGCELAPGGHVSEHLHSYEESFFVVEGRPRLRMGGETIELGPGTCGFIPVGVSHAWHNADSQSSRWLDMLAPQPRVDTQPSDTFFTSGRATSEEPRPLDVRDPRCRHFFRLDDGQMDVERLKHGSRVSEPTVSASMATALLAYSGIAVKMLVDQRMEAHCLTMFMVEYQPGGVAHPHDHPFEEAYVVLDGEVEAVADGRSYMLRAGDVLWTGVGCIHAFYNRTDRTVRWLETQAPQPPRHHSYRFERDWEYLHDRLEATSSRPGSMTNEATRR